VLRIEKPMTTIKKMVNELSGTSVKVNVKDIMALLVSIKSVKNLILGNEPKKT
jgi:hypothetical protein